VKKDEDIFVGKDVDDVKPVKLSRMDPQVQEELRSRMRDWRINAFLWGWMWCSAFHLLLNGFIPGKADVFMCVVLAVLCAMGHYHGRKVSQVPVFLIKK
jgi:hypothetical protein